MPGDENLDLNAVGGAIGWDEENGQGYLKAVKELLGIGEGEDALLARGRISEREQKASLVLLSRAARSTTRKRRKKAREEGLKWNEMPEQRRAVLLNLALSISQDGKGRGEVVSSLIGTSYRAATSWFRDKNKKGKSNGMES